MLYELRVYEIAPGRRKALVDRFANHGIRIFHRHGIHPTLLLRYTNTILGDVPELMSALSDLKK